MRRLKEGAVMEKTKGITVSVSVTDTDVFKDMIRVIEEMISDQEIPSEVRNKYKVKIEKNLSEFCFESDVYQLQKDDSVSR